MALQDSRRLLRGWRPKRDSWYRRRFTASISLWNSYAGKPQQNEVYDWQWIVYAKAELVIVALCGIGLVLGIVLSLKGCQ